MKTFDHKLLPPEIQYGLSLAWKATQNARKIKETGTTVGACAGYKDIATGKMIYATGCNIEHKYRCHDIHAEVNAISNLINNNGRQTPLEFIIIVSKREQFTPCGGCMDWIMEIGGPTCNVIIQGISPKEKVNFYLAQELMPYYPK
ncbi:MAG: hypothetical protein ACTSRA_23385 [Promethearchaeota archaeon]